MTRRDALQFGAVALVLALVTVYVWTSAPTYTDAYYYINAANRLVTGDGMTDAYLWMYINAPDALPAPSHLYWMPMASWTAAVGMWLWRAPEVYWAAQFPFALMLALVGFSAYWLAYDMGGARRHAWVAGIIVILGGFFSRFWGVAETFTPFAAFGVGALIALGRGMRSRDWRWFALAGMFTAGAHLTRADGILFVLAGWAALFWFWHNPISWRQRFGFALVLLLAYLLTMTPWFMRSLDAFGAPLPVGGTQGIWFTEYNDIFNYPPDASPAQFFENGGWALFASSRWTGVSAALGTLLAVEGLVVLAPLMLWALVKRWQEPFLRPMWIYALGLHAAMSLVFPFPGYRGGLFHSVTALSPFWVVLGLFGLDDFIRLMARVRRWNPRTATPFFTVMLVVIAAALSVFVGMGGRVTTATDDNLYRALQDVLPDDARVMINDPASLYYHTGHGGVVLPNESPDILPQIAERYGVDYLLIEQAAALDSDAVGWALPIPLLTLTESPPDFLIPVSLNHPTARLYRFELDTQP